MRRHFKLLLAIAMLALLPLEYFGQVPQYTHNQSTIDFNITDINIFDERVFFMYNLVNDGRFNVVNSENDGVFIVSIDPSYKGLDLKTAFDEFREQNAFEFSMMDKEEASEKAVEYKAALPQEITLSLMMDVYIKSRQNNLCANADPFCTDNGMYEFPAGVNAGSGENGPNYNCLSSTPNPAWYFMRIGTPGSMTIHMYSSPSHDIDFCCWGPFDDPVAPCPNGLVASKVVSCSYSTSSTENCQIPSSAQTGQYYILVITNYSNQTCNIHFSKTSGNGTTDCSILPPLVENGGPYCVGETIQLTGNAQSGATYSWSGPGGWTANGHTVTRPNCTLDMAGDYTCTIRVGTQTNSAQTLVRVYAVPTANFTSNTVCLGETTRFTNTSTTSPANQTMTYQWDFGDGQTSTQQSPSHQFSTAGNHNVTLTASCGNGTCNSSKTQTVVVYDNPTANAGSDQTVQYGGIAQLRGSSSTGTTNFNYRWAPADKVANPNAQNTQTIALHESTTFTLTVTHPQGGCSSTDEMTVLVEGSNMTATASANPATICLGETSQLRAQAVGGTGNFTYSWSPSVGLSNPLIANPVATPTETTTYTCTVSDGFSTQNISTTINVNQPEYEDMHEYICPGDSFPFYDGNSYSEEGNYVYHTTTAQGCEKTITLHLHHYPTYDNGHTTDTAICYSSFCPFHGHNYYTSGVYSETLETVHGCDSVVWLNLTVYPANDTIIDKQYICADQTLTWHGHEYSQDGDTAYYHTEDYHGCLQVYKLELAVRDYQTPSNYTPDKFICVPHNEQPYYHWDIADRDYYQNAQDTIIVEGSPCDYMYTLNLQFHQEHYYQPEPVTECDSYYWPISGETYNSTNHHIKHYKYTEFGPNQQCHDTYELDLTINKTYEGDTVVTKQCNQFDWQFGWNGETYTYYEPGEDYTRVINTHEDGTGCDSIVTLHLQMDYTPNFEKINGKQWPIGGSEFQYTVEQYWIETDPRSSHVTEWKLFDSEGNLFNKWEIIPYDNTDKCYLYIYTFERDSIRLEAHSMSTSECECGEDTKSMWIHCSSYDVNEITDPCNVDIYPNPNDGNMTLSFDNLIGEALVKVYNITGTMVDQFTLHNDFGHVNYTYQSSKLTPGVYFFTITNKKSILTKKVVIID